MVGVRVHDLRPRSAYRQSPTTDSDAPVGSLFRAFLRSPRSFADITFRPYIMAVYGFFTVAVLLFGGQFFGQFMVKDPELYQRDPDLWTPMTAVAGVMTFLVLATAYRKHQLSIRAIAAQTTSIETMM